MKKKFDFVLSDDPGFNRTIFRFYPRRTHVHSFNDDPPKTWEEVYKVYYSWAIIRQYYNDNNKIVPEKSMVLFEVHCDECSEIPNLSAIIKYVMRTDNIYDDPTCGQPAGDWRVEKQKWEDYFTRKDCEMYCFYVFDNLSTQGCRFFLNKDGVLKFCDWLDMINQYALDHGEGI